MRLANTDDYVDDDDDDVHDIGPKRKVKEVLK